MSLLSGVSAFFGLDIGTTAIRLVELHGNGPVKTLVKYAYVPVDSKLVLSDSKSDQQKLAQVIKDLLAQARMTTRNVAVGIPSARVFTAVVDFDRLPPAELAKAIRYQADSLIPTPLDKSKIDWAVIGDSPKDKTKVEVLLSSVENEFVEQRLDLLESIGLEVIAFEPDNLALTRALVAQDGAGPQMVLDIGSKSTDLVVTMNGAPRLTRSIPTGAEAIIRAASQNLNIEEKQARQFVFKFGLGKDKLEGRIYDAIISTVDILTGEIDKSIKFFQSRYGENQKVSRIIVTGGASALPEFPLFLANKFAVEVEIGNAWRNVSFSPERQNELLAVSNHFGVASGLAERIE
ncbi:MAG TPA: type IV pilus assembly protein PilM [Candidatus Saccharimonadales bacterium]|jgi:type IV pilus assembly protein PilM|nr:type IV pilus assembly protein PilM [Candidatus Saccharimonadales bacterium]